jgi:hypothetical protein
VRCFRRAFRRELILRYLTSKPIRTNVPGLGTPRSASALGTIRTINYVGLAPIEELIARCQPLLNCLLFFAGSYITVRHPPQCLQWIGIPNDLLAVSDDAQRRFVRLWIYTGTCALVFATIDGRGSRRIFAALAFPCLPALAILAGAVAVRVSTVLPPSADDMTWAMVLRSFMFGMSAALLMCLPTEFLYHTRATAIAGFAMILAIAQEAAKTFHRSASMPSYAALLLEACSYATFLLVASVLHALLSHHLSGRSRRALPKAA